MNGILKETAARGVQEKTRRGLALLCCLLAALCVFPLTARGADIVLSGVCGENVTFSLDRNGLLTISGSGPMRDYEFQSVGTPEWRYMESDCHVTSLRVEKGVTRIGKYAFYNMSDMEKAVIADGVTEIASCAFQYCDSLKDVSIPDSVVRIGSSALSSTGWYKRLPDGPVYAGKVLYDYKGNMPEGTALTVKSGTKGIAEAAFYGDKSLMSVTLPDSLREIGNIAFYYCTDLKTVTVPSGVRKIGEWAFHGCTALSELTLPDSLTSIGKSAFGMTPWFNSLPDGPAYVGRVFLKYIGEAPSDPSFSLKAGTKAIAGAAFQNCGWLTSVTLPDSVTEIGNYAFEKCSGLTSLSMPASLTSIGKGAFSSCSALKKVEIPDLAAWYGVSFGDSGANPLSNGGSLYAGGRIVSSAQIPAGTKAVAPYAFYGCQSLTGVTLPDSVTSIGEGAFGSCSALRAVTFGSRLKTIGGSAFGGCESLTSLSLPDGLTSIGNSAFHWCAALQSVVLPKNLKEIGRYAFSDCSALKKVEIPDLAAWCGVSFENREANPVSDGAALSVGGKTVSSVQIPAGTKALKPFVFCGCKALTGVTLPDGVTEIGESAFADCSALRAVTIGNGLKTVGKQAFSGCSYLQKLTLPEGTERIDEEAFLNCGALRQLTVPDSVISVGKKAVTGTPYANEQGQVVYVGKVLWRVSSSLTSVSIREDTRTIESEVFANSKIGSVKIPDSVTVIGKGAFRNCKNLTALTLPAGLKEIPDDMCRECKALRDMAMPDSVTQIGAFAFYYCEKLITTLPPGLVSVGEDAFCLCDNFTDGAFPETLVSIGRESFWGCDITDLTLPDSLRVIPYGAFSFAPLKEITLGSLVERIEPYAFCYESYRFPYSFVCLPASVKYVAEDAFQSGICICYAGTAAQWKQVDCPLKPEFYNVTIEKPFIYNKNRTAIYGLTAPYDTLVIYLPKRVTKINDGAFSKGRLGDVFYQGNEEDWNKLEIGVNNHSLLNAYLHLSHTHAISKETALTPATCTENGLREGVCACGVPTKETLQKTGHSWSCRWEWADDFSAATAHFTCANDPAHTADKTVKPVKGTTVPAACETAGTIPYTVAVVLENKTYEDAKEKVLEPIGHKYGDPVWNWKEDGSEATATFTCLNDPAHQQALTDDMPLCETLREATYEHEGNRVFTAGVTLNDKTYQNKLSVVVPVVERTYTDPVWSWSADRSEATLTMKNRETGATRSLTTRARSSRAEPTCTANGSVTYTASIAVEELSYTDTQKVTLPAPGHNWGPWTVSGGSATHTCMCDPKHKETVSLNGTLLNGDVDGNGKVTSGDARLSLRCSVKLEIYAKGSQEYLCADADGDGTVSSGDARLILRASVGLERLPQKQGGIPVDTGAPTVHQNYVRLIRLKGRVQPDGTTVLRTSYSTRFEYDPATDGVRYVYEYDDDRYVITTSDDGATVYINGGRQNAYDATLTIRRDAKVEASDIKMTYHKEYRYETLREMDRVAAVQDITRVFAVFLEDSADFGKINYDQDTVELTDVEKMSCYTKKYGKAVGMIYTLPLADNAELVYDEETREMCYVYRSTGSTSYECTVVMDSLSSGALSCVSASGAPFTAKVLFLDSGCSLSDVKESPKDYNAKLINELIRTNMQYNLHKPITAVSPKIRADKELTEYLYFGLPEKK